MCQAAGGTIRDSNSNEHSDEDYCYCKNPGEPGIESPQPMVSTKAGCIRHDHVLKGYLVQAESG